MKGNAPRVFSATLFATVVVVGATCIAALILAESQGPSSNREAGRLEAAFPSLLGERIDVFRQSELERPASGSTLLFLLPRCGSCNVESLDLEAVVSLVGDRLVFLSFDSADATRDLFPQVGGHPLLDRVGRRLVLPGDVCLPSLLWIDPNGTVRRELTGATAIASFLEEASS